jgi:hypothetical protein
MLKRLVSRSTAEDIDEVLTLHQETVERLATSLLDPLSDRISQSRKATLDQKDVDLPDSRKSVSLC